MTRAETASLRAMTPEQLVEGFVRETKLYELSDLPAANAALEKKIAFAEEIVRRGGESSLETLMANTDQFIAYSAADQLVDLPNYRDRAIAVPDQFADAKAGTASTGLE